MIRRSGRRGPYSYCVVETGFAAASVARLSITNSAALVGKFYGPSTSSTNNIVISFIQCAEEALLTQHTHTLVVAPRRLLLGLHACLGTKQLTSLCQSYYTFLSCLLRRISRILIPHSQAVRCMMMV